MSSDRGGEGGGLKGVARTLAESALLGRDFEQILDA